MAQWSALRRFGAKYRKSLEDFAAKADDDRLRQLGLSSREIAALREKPREKLELEIAERLHDEIFNTRPIDDALT